MKRVRKCLKDTDAIVERQLLTTMVAPPVAISTFLHQQTQKQEIRNMAQKRKATPKKKVVKKPPKILSLKSPNRDQNGRLFIGDMFTDEGCPYYVTKFPTRSMVCGVAKYKYAGAPSGIKCHIKDVKWMSNKNTLRRSERHVIGRALCFGTALMNKNNVTQVDRERKLFLKAVAGHRKVMDDLCLKGKTIH